MGVEDEMCKDMCPNSNCIDCCLEWLDREVEQADGKKHSVKKESAVSGNWLESCVTMDMIPGEGSILRRRWFC